MADPQLLKQLLKDLISACLRSKKTVELEHYPRLHTTEFKVDDSQYDADFPFHDVTLCAINDVSGVLNQMGCSVRLLSQEDCTVMVSATKKLITTLRGNPYACTDCLDYVYIGLEKPEFIESDEEDSSEFMCYEIPVENGKRVKALAITFVKRTEKRQRSLFHDFTLINFRPIV